MGYGGPTRTRGGGHGGYHPYGGQTLRTPEEAREFILGMDMRSTFFQKLLTEGNAVEPEMRSLYQRIAVNRVREETRAIHPPTFPIRDDTPLDLRGDLITWQKNPIGIPNPIRDIDGGFMNLDDMDVYKWLQTIYKQGQVWKAVLAPRLAKIFTVEGRWWKKVDKKKIKMAWPSPYLRERNRLVVWANVPAMSDREIINYMAEIGCTEVDVRTKIEPYFKRAENKEMGSNALRIANDARIANIAAKKMDAGDDSADEIVRSLDNDNRFHVLSSPNSGPSKIVEDEEMDSQTGTPPGSRAVTPGLGPNQLNKQAGVEKKSDAAMEGIIGQEEIFPAENI